MATISNTPRPGYAWDATDNCWYPIGTGPHTHSDYITQSTAINPAIVDAKGDLIVGSAADTVIRKPVGTDGQLLYADSTATGGIKWDAAPVSGSMTLLSTSTLSGATFTINSISGSYKKLHLEIYGVTFSAASVLTVKPNGTSSIVTQTGAESVGNLNINNDRIYFTNAWDIKPTGGLNAWTLEINNYASTSAYKSFSTTGEAQRNDNNSLYASTITGGGIQTTSAIPSLQFLSGGAPTLSGGTVLLYGVN